MYRLATLLALFALVIAGCGGSADETSEPAGSAVVKTRGAEASSDDGGKPPPSESEAKRKNLDDEEREDESQHDDEAEDEDDEHKGHAEAHEDAGEQQSKTYLELPRKRQLLILRTVAKSALLQFGLELADARIRNGGRKATVLVKRKSACRAVASQEPNIALAIKQGVPGVKSVRFEVAGTGQELGYYVLDCKRPKMPSGPGRVVLEHTGVGGPYTSKRFEIKSKRWALEWENQGASLAVIVAPVGDESKPRYVKPVGSQKPESGRYNYKGRGVFQIKAYGAGRWSIRIKEIGSGG